MSEMDALWYHLEPMCEEYTEPRCGYCGQPMELVPPERLYYSCREDFPGDFTWKPVTREDL